jgi:hypothetical protein
VGPSTGLFDLGGQRLVTPPIRGRVDELKVIGALVTALARGRGGVLVIEGPPGIGKSRLLTEVMALADKGGVRALFGEAFEYQQTVPFFSLFMATLRADPPIGDADALRRLGSSADLRYWVVHNLADAIHAAAAQTPLAILLEDIHWADSGTLLARKRNELLAATQALLARIAERVDRGTLTGAGRIGEAVGRVINKYKVGKHFRHQITDTSFTYQRDEAAIAAEAALDGIYVLRTSAPTTDLDAAAVVESYKNLAHVERDFRSIKTDDLDLRPIHHRLSDRVKAHVLICLLACHLTWHLRKAWAPLTYTDEHPPARDNPVAPAQRSPAAQAKASRQQTPDGTPLRDFRALLDHLATQTRNRIRYHHTNIEIDTLTEPTPEQRRAFDLIDATIPLTLAA